MSDSFDQFGENTWSTAKGQYVPPAQRGDAPQIDPVQAISDVAGVVAPIIPGAQQVKALVDILHPHVESGAVTPEAAIVSLASVLTRWIK